MRVPSLAPDKQAPKHGSSSREDCSPALRLDHAADLTTPAFGGVLCALVSSLQALVTAGFLALAGFTVVDCGNVIAACDKKCDCEQCETSARNACIATGESDQHTALSAGCSGELDDLQTCQATTGICKDVQGGKMYVTDCDAQEDAWKKCTATTK